MRAVKSVSIDSERRVIITYLDGSTETLFPEQIDYDEAIIALQEEIGELKEDISNFNDLGLSVVDGAINITYEETSV